MKTIIKEITPELAEEMLEHNYEGNRNVMPTQVREFASVMADGRFDSLNGQTIVIDSDGTLYDGQHRLQAIIMAGVTLPFLVVVHDSPTRAIESFDTIDNGATRKTAQFIHAKNKNACASASKFMVCLEQGTQGIAGCVRGYIKAHLPADRQLIVNFFENHADEIINISQRAISMRTVMRCGPASEYAQFIALVKFCRRDSALDSFVTDYCKEIPKSIAVTRARNAIVRANGEGAAPKRGWHLGVLLYCYEKYRDGIDFKAIRSTESTLRDYEQYLIRVRKNHNRFEVS